MFDHQAGTGLVADAWNEDPVYVRGTEAKPNTCYEFVERLLAKMDLEVILNVTCGEDTMSRSCSPGAKSGGKSIYGSSGNPRVRPGLR